MHDGGVVLAGKDVARSIHVGGKLVNFVDSVDGRLGDGLVAEIA
jgi:hypothetical protein